MSVETHPPVTEARTNDALASNRLKAHGTAWTRRSELYLGRAHGTKLANLEFHSQIRSID